MISIRRLSIACRLLEGVILAGIVLSGSGFAQQCSTCPSKRSFLAGNGESCSRCDDASCAEGGAANTPDSVLGNQPPAPPGSAESQQSWLSGDERALNPHRFFGLPDERARGPGKPLVHESWLYRPWSVGFMVGLIEGGDVIDDWVSQRAGYVGGLRLGWDWNPYFGLDVRCAWAGVEFTDSYRAILAQIAQDDSKGWGPYDRRRNRFDGRRVAQMAFYDFSVVYYFWGDSAWRPYVSAGIGFAKLNFYDRLSVHYDTFMAEIPLAIGMKYRVTDGIALRVEVSDSICFGGGETMSHMNEFMFTAGFEARFGGKRRAYWPWNPDRHYW